MNKPIKGVFKDQIKKFGFVFLVIFITLIPTQILFGDTVSVICSTITGLGATVYIRRDEWMDKLK